MTIFETKLLGISFSGAEQARTDVRALRLSQFLAERSRGLVRIKWLHGQESMDHSHGQIGSQTLSRGCGSCRKSAQCYSAVYLNPCGMAT